jgi:hypothetical protein
MRTVKSLFSASPCLYDIFVEIKACVKFRTNIQREDQSGRCVIVLMMEAASTSETSVNVYQTTRCNIPEDSRLHIRRRENLKSHLIVQPVYTFLRKRRSNRQGS